MRDKLFSDWNHFEPGSKNPPLVAPIHLSAKYTFSSMHELREFFKGDLDGYFYARFRNPTVARLEAELSNLQGTEAGICTSTGASALLLIMLQLLNSGDEVLYFIQSYKPTRMFIESFLKKYGVKGVRLSNDQPTEIKKALESPRAKLLMFESPTNPQLSSVDGNWLCTLARENKVLTVLDNTLAGLHNHRSWPVDYYIHSLTKFVNGHSDGMGGAILSSRKNINDLFTQAGECGFYLDAHSAYLSLRGLKTYQLRYDRQLATTIKLYHFLKNHSAIESATVAEQNQDCSGVPLLFFSLKNKDQNIDIIIDNLKYFVLSASLGSTESLVAPVMMFYGGDLSPAECLAANIDDTSIRLSVGLEDSEDLLADLDKAFTRLT